MNRQLVIFTLDTVHCGLELESVQRIMRMMEIVPLPTAPDIILGVINHQGFVIPVINLRRRFQMPERRPASEDLLILARGARRDVALLVDSVGAVIDGDEDWVPADAAMPGTDHIKGMLVRPDGLILIHDLDAFLSLDEEQILDSALARAG